jgi:hypothetical protein
MCYTYMHTYIHTHTYTHKTKRINVPTMNEYAYSCVCILLFKQHRPHFQSNNASNVQIVIIAARHISLPTHTCHLYVYAYTYSIYIQLHTYLFSRVTMRVTSKSSSSLLDTSSISLTGTFFFFLPLLFPLDFLLVLVFSVLSMRIATRTLLPWSRALAFSPVCVCVFVCVCARACVCCSHTMHVCCVCACVCVYIYIYICMYVCICIIYTHTYIHT